jgi:hypothetical protein
MKKLFLVAALACSAGISKSHAQAIVSGDLKIGKTDYYKGKRTVQPGAVIFCKGNEGKCVSVRKVNVYDEDEFLVTIDPDGTAPVTIEATAVVAVTILDGTAITITPKQ